MNTYAFLIVVLGTTLATLVVGLWRASPGSFSVYASDPKRYNWVVIGLTIGGTVIGGGMFLGISQLGYEAGVLGFLLGLIYLVGIGLLGAFAKSARGLLADTQHGTLIELLDSIYGSHFAFLFAVVNLAMYLFLFAGQLVALNTFARFIQPHVPVASLWLIVIPVLFGMVLYPVIGGLRKDIQTDVVQMAVIALGAAMLVVVVFTSGAFLSGWRRMPESALMGTTYGPLFPIGSIVFLTPSFLVRMDMWQRIGAARTDRDAKWGLWFGGALSCVAYCVFTIVGIGALGSGVKHANLAAPELLILRVTHPIAAGAVVGAFFAALLSTADTLLNNLSLFAARVFASRLWAVSAGGRRLLRISRVFAVLGVLVAAGLAYASSNFVDLFVGALSLLLVFVGPAVGLFVPEARSAKGAVVSSSLGVVIFLVLFFCWDPKLAFAPGVFAAVLAYLAFLAGARTAGRQPATGSTT